MQKETAASVVYKASCHLVRKQKSINWGGGEKRGKGGGGQRMPIKNDVLLSVAKYKPDDTKKMSNRKPLTDHLSRYLELTHKMIRFKLR